MKTITEMREEIGALMKQLGDMKAAAMSDNREPTDEEKTRAIEILDRVEELEGNIAIDERVQETEARLSKPQEKPVKPEVKESAVSPAEQRRKDSFLTFGEQLQAIIRAGDPQRTVDPRLMEQRASGLNEGVSSEGGFLVQSDFAANLIKTVFETGKLASRINRISLGAGKNGLTVNGIDESSRATGSRWGGVRMYWLDEAAEKTKSKPKFRQIELKLKKLIGLCYATDELLEDAAALESVVTQSFQNEMGFMIDDAVINGSGAGQPLGILNSPCLVSQAIETGQSAQTVLFENVIKMWSRLLPDSRGNAVWLINPDVEPALATMYVAAGTGGIPVYMPAGGYAGATVQPFATLFGRPVIPMEQCQTLGTKGDIYLGDFSKYMAIDKGGMKQDVSIHVRFIYDESILRFVYRFDGQPIFNKAITPFKGSNTMSPFITLAART
jgi:HK97 family phage major capsid protein